jgi:hypothetical protein
MPDSHMSWSDVALNVPGSKVALHTAPKAQGRMATRNHDVCFLGSSIHALSMLC